MVLRTIGGSSKRPRRFNGMELCASQSLLSVYHLLGIEQKFYVGTCQMSQGLLCFANITVISSEWTEQTDACLEVGSDLMVLKLERLRSPRSIIKRVLKLEFEDETPPNISRKMSSVTSYLTCISREWTTTLPYSDPWFLPRTTGFIFQSSQEPWQTAQLHSSAVNSTHPPQSVVGEVISGEPRMMDISQIA